MNSCSLIGRLSKDVDLKATEKTSVAKFSLAVARKVKGEVDFINCTAFGKTAEFLSNYFSKGSMIGILGRIQTGSYEKDGKKVYTTDVIVEQCFFTGGKQEKQGDAYEENTKENTNIYTEDSDNGLPF